MQAGALGKPLGDDVAGVGNGDYDAAKTAGHQLGGNGLCHGPSGLQLLEPVLLHGGAAGGQHHHIGVGNVVVAACRHLYGMEQAGDGVGDVFCLADGFLPIDVQQHDLVADALGRQTVSYMRAHMAGA